jgi:F-type H+-transporting ATPase subunit a
MINRFFHSEPNPTFAAALRGVTHRHSSMKSLIHATFLAFGILLAPMVANAGGGGEKEKFQSGEMIMGHVTDEHGWHLWGHTSLPLPVIIYNSQRGLSIFSSARFDHGHATYGGYMLDGNKVLATTAPDGTDASVAPIDESLTASTIDFSITKNVLAIFVSVALMLIVFLSLAKAYTRRPGQAPKGLQSFIEPIIVFVRDEVAKPNIGPKYAKFMPFLLTVFFFILINNLMGLIPIFPGGANVTGSISVAFTLAVITFVLTLINGNRHYWGHIIAMPGVPKPVLLILTPVEILGVFLRPAILMIRLFANITAGHIIVLSFFSLIFIFGEINTGLGWGVSVFTLVFTIFMSMLELLVAFIQAFVFTFLSAMYLGAAIEEPHHH